MKKGLPAVLALGKPSKALEFADADEEGEDLPNDNDAEAGEKQKAAEKEEGSGDEMDEDDDDEDGKPANAKKIQPPTQDEYIWMWKVCDVYSTSTFFIVRLSFYSRISKQQDGHFSFEDHVEYTSTHILFIPCSSRPSHCIFSM